MRCAAAVARIAGIAAIAAGSTASAQNALGTGSALDRNLQRGGGGVNAPVRNYTEEIRLRQAIVTGDVAGGRGFRGSVGYTAANDFRGSLGSNSIYFFVADAFRGGGGSIGSAYQGSPYRGVNALQQQMGLTVGGGATILSRAGSGVSAGQISAFDGIGARSATIDPFRQSESGLLSRSGSLRSTSGFVTGEASEAQRFDVTKRSGERVSAGASTLRGVFEEPLLRGRFQETAMESRASSESPAARLESNPLGSRVSEPAEPSPLRTRIEPARVYDNLLRSLGKTEDDKPEAPQGQTPGAPGSDKGKDAPSADPLRAKLDQLRERLMPAAPEEWASGERKTEKQKADEKREQTAQTLEAGNIREFTKDVFGDRRPLVPTFLDPSDDPSGYQRNLSEGEEALRAGRWFDAEEAFTRALRYRSGEPIALIGRVHAQLGAGMFLSAAVNLRDTLRAHPELAAARYDAGLLPREMRLETLMDTLRDNAKRSDVFGRDNALLLAYMGWQAGSESDVRAGFEAVRRVEDYLDLERDPLHDVLEAVWLE